MLYIIIFFLLALCSFLRVSKLKTFLYYSFILSLILLCGLRDTSIGTDTKGGYLSYFTSISQGYDLFFVEPGWVFLNKLAIYLNLDYQGVLFFSAFLCIVPIFFVLHYENINRFLGLFIYYGMYLYLHSFNMIRQCIAMSFCLLAICFFLKKRWFLFFVYMGTAFLFHKSAIIFFLVPAFIKLKINLKRITMLLLLSLFFGFVGSEPFFIFLAGPYAGYLEESASGFRDNSAIIKLLIFLMNVFYYFILAVASKKVLNESYSKMLLLGYCCMNATMSLELGTRLMFYFTQVQIVFYPKYFQSKKKDKYFLMFIFILYIFVNFIKILIGQWGELVPYKSFLFG